MTDQMEARHDDLVDVSRNLEEEEVETDDETSELSTEEDVEKTDESSESSTEEDLWSDDETGESLTEEDDEMETFRNDGKMIVFDKIDEELRLAHNETVEKSQKPSMWQYDPKGGVPTELANLDPSTFSTSRQGQILCSLPKDILIRICSMLSVRDFLNLSMICRFLHWRMFTFCTCYAPCTVIMGVHDYQISPKILELAEASSKLAYNLTKEIINEEKEDDDDEGQKFRVDLYVMQTTGERGLFVYQPFCLRKPFFFSTLIIQLYFPFYYKKYYDMCLPYILAIRGLANNLELLFIHQYDNPRKPYINFSDTNDFLSAINTTYYDSIFKRNKWGDKNNDEKHNIDVYLNCPYARQMNRVFIFPQYEHGRLDVPVLENNIGIYWTVDSTVKATLKNFLTGSMNLTYHQYLGIQGNNSRPPLVEYLFEELGEFEYFYAERSNNCRYIWKKEITADNGGQLRIVIDKGKSTLIHVRIGKVETFERMDTKYAMHPIYREGTVWWKMETAVEPDGTEKLNLALQSNEVEEPTGTEESDVDEELDESGESDEVEESVEAEEPDEVEEEQRTPTVCHFCSIL